MNASALFRPLSAELADRAMDATRNLIAVLGAFPLDRWRAGKWNEWPPDKLHDLARYQSELFEIPDDPCDPWKFVVTQLADDPRQSGHRLLRALIPMLLAAEAIHLPSVYIHTLCAVSPVLSILADLIFVAVIEIEECDVPGTWGHDLYRARCVVDNIVAEVYQIPIPPRKQ